MAGFLLWNTPPMPSLRRTFALEILPQATRVSEGTMERGHRGAHNDLLEGIFEAKFEDRFFFVPDNF